MPPDISAARLMNQTTVISQLKWNWHTHPRPFSIYNTTMKLVEAQWDHSSSFSGSDVCKVLMVFCLKLPNRYLDHLSKSDVFSPSFCVESVQLPNKPSTQWYVQALQMASRPQYGLPLSCQALALERTWLLLWIPLMGGIINSLADPNQNQTTLVNDCSTGNCTFPARDGITHSTIGMCSQCIDITSESRIFNNIPMDYNEDVWTSVTLPNGLTLRVEIGLGPGQALNASGGRNNSLDSILSQVEEHDFAAITPASAFNWTMVTLTGCSPPCNYSDIIDLYVENAFLSTACSCMRHYAGLVDRGEFNETLVSTVPALPVSP